MKRVLAMILAICMVTTVLAMTVVGVQAASGDVFRVSGQKKDGTLVELKSSASFTEGWNYAMRQATDHDWMSENGYVRIVVDLLADWNAVDGEFSEDGGKGFKWGTIRVYEKALITLNLNGHTVNRGLTDWEYNGEVIFVDDGADLIINGGKDAEDTQTGTVTGGFSCNGAGGIHVEDGVDIILNNVNIVGNAVEDDLGAAIVILEGSELIINGGKIEKNRLQKSDSTIFEKTHGTVYIEDGKATFNKVNFSDNICVNESFHGLAVYLEGDGKATLNDCTVEKYGENCTEQGPFLPESLFYNKDEESQLILNGCTVKDNSVSEGVISTVGTIKINDCTFTNNKVQNSFFHLDWKEDDISFDIKNSTFTDNPFKLLTIHGGRMNSDKQFKFTNCTFNNNGTEADYAIKGDSYISMKFVDCDLGDTVFVDRDHIIFTDTDAEDGVNSSIGSVFGVGSLTTIVAFLALFISLGTIGAIITSRMKKTSLPDAENHTEGD